MNMYEGNLSKFFAVICAVSMLLIAGCAGGESSDDLAQAAAILAANEQAAEPTAADMKFLAAVVQAADSAKGNGEVDQLQLNDALQTIADLYDGITDQGLAIAEVAIKASVPEHGMDLAMSILNTVKDSLKLPLNPTEQAAKLAESITEIVLAANRMDIDYEVYGDIAGLMELHESIANDFDFSSFFGSNDAKAIGDNASLLDLLNESIKLADGITTAQEELAETILLAVFPEDSKMGAIVKHVMTATRKGIDDQLLAAGSIGQKFYNLIVSIQSGEATPAQVAEQLNIISQEIQETQLGLAVLIVDAIIPAGPLQDVLNSIFDIAYFGVSTAHEIAQTVINTVRGADKV